jgi:hypothetical protein
VGIVAAGGVAAVLALTFASVALWWWLREAMHPAWAALIVTAVWALVAAVAVAVGRQQVGSARGLTRTTESMKKIKPALSGHEEQNR